MAHPWFVGMDWEKLRLKQVDPPFVPDVRFYMLNKPFTITLLCLNRIKRPTLIQLMN